MLRRLSIGLLSLAAAVAVAACSSSDTTVPSSGGVPGIGPNFATNTVYVSNTTQNAVSLYLQPLSANSTPAYQIGGGSTSLSGPQYLAFDSAKRLFVSNYNASTNAASIEVYQTYAQGNVVPFNTFGVFSGITYPHGLAIDKFNDIVVANTKAPAPLTDEVLVIPTGYASPSPSPFTNVAVIAGSNTGLSTPWGVGLDASSNIYVSNRGNGTVTVYAAPSPTPTPVATATPAPTPTPSTTPAPTPTPTPFSFNQAPIATIPGLGAPMGLTVASNGKIYVADPDNGNASVYVFNPIAGGTATLLQRINGAATGLVFPTDVKVDSSGTIYVVDSGASKIFTFAANATGNVAPTLAITYSGGTPIGLALSP